MLSPSWVRPEVLVPGESPNKRFWKRPASPKDGAPESTVQKTQLKTNRISSATRDRQHCHLQKRLTRRRALFTVNALKLPTKSYLTEGVKKQKSHHTTCWIPLGHRIPLQHPPLITTQSHPISLLSHHSRSTPYLLRRVAVPPYKTTTSPAW